MSQILHHEFIGNSLILSQDFSYEFEKCSLVRNFRPTFKICQRTIEDWEGYVMVSTFVDESEYVNDFLNKNEERKDFFLIVIGLLLFQQKLNLVSSTTNSYPSTKWTNILKSEDCSKEKFGSRAFGR